MFVQIAVFCLLATIAAVSGHEGHVHSPAPAPGPATNSAVVPTTNMFTGLAFAAVALVLGLNHWVHHHYCIQLFLFGSVSMRLFSWLFQYSFCSIKVSFCCLSYLVNKTKLHWTCVVFYYDFGFKIRFIGNTTQIKSQSKNYDMVHYN